MMQELHQELAKEGSFDQVFDDLLKTSVKWAKYVLENNTGEALNQGLEISKALANYYHEIYS